MGRSFRDKILSRDFNNLPSMSLIPVSQLDVKKMQDLLLPLPKSKTSSVRQGNDKCWKRVILFLSVSKGLDPSISTSISDRTFAAH